MSLRGFLLAGLLLIAGCAGTSDLPPVPAYAASHLNALSWRAVIVAGDASISAFDNAAERLARDLATRRAADPADIHRYSARTRRPAGIQLASVGNVLDGIAALKPGSGEGCLVFATAHGAQDRGLVFPANQSDTYLDPDRLHRALAIGCGNAPTVVILSGCFSGGYLHPPMLRANRVILTAARRDRTSFGCGAGNVYTEFDDCLIGAMESGHGAWQDVFSAARLCVSARERVQNVLPSEPQSFVGASVAALGLPWRTH
ncbi:MAG: hypothetical protein NT133_26755 [Alphaproteobacteria bacterium]|nr:hypothetical protein [Alphaproteobacteria bacterium]